MSNVYFHIEKAKLHYSNLELLQVIVLNPQNLAAAAGYVMRDKKMESETERDDRQKDERDIERK